MSSNYPPGVTGGEYQITGPDAEWDDERTCENEACVQYLKPQVATVQCYQYDQWWVCETCDTQHDEPLEDRYV